MAGFWPIPVVPTGIDLILAVRSTLIYSSSSNPRKALQATETSVTRNRSYFGISIPTGISTIKPLVAIHKLQAVQRQPYFILTNQFHHLPLNPPVHVILIMIQ